VRLGSEVVVDNNKIDFFNQQQLVVDWKNQFFLLNY
jgi:hypothetical protein